jgi:hypothetical protein
MNLEVIRTIASKMARIIPGTQKARGKPLFLGFEHSGLYPLRTSAETIAAWYGETFGFALKEEGASFFLSGPGAGRLEVMKNTSGKASVHIAVHVSDFEEAIAALRAKGVRLKDPMIQPDLKIVYLQDADPEGNPVHLWWSR